MHCGQLKKMETKVNLKAYANVQKHFHSEIFLYICISFKMETKVNLKAYANVQKDFTVKMFFEQKY